MKAFEKSETWKAVRGCRDSNKKNNARSGCGVAVKAVDKETVTVSDIAVPVKVSTAMATEIAGVRVRTEVRDLHSAKILNMQTVTDCMKQNEDDTETEKMWM